MPSYAGTTSRSTTLISLTGGLGYEAAGSDGCGSDGCVVRGSELGDARGDRRVVTDPYDLGPASFRGPVFKTPSKGGIGLPKKKGAQSPAFIEAKAERTARAKRWGSGGGG